jgi:rRNA maturation RNase YbeY
VVKGYNSVPGHLSFVFCSDDHLLKVNQQFLQHDYFTDIITFDYTEGDRVSGDLMISIDRVKDNAIALNIPFEIELRRVMIHGVLHLLGFKDKSPKESEKMRLLEADALAQLSENQ